MSTLKVDTISNNGTETDTPQGFTIAGNSIVQGYTESANEPSGEPNEGDIWWDTTNSVLKRYVNGVWRTITTGGGSGSSGGGSGSSGWSITSIANTSYDSKSFNQATYDTAPWAVKFSTDGTKMYVLGNQNDSVRQYSLSTAWDVSTASYDSINFTVATQGTPRGLTFSTDGTKMYMIEATGNHEVHQYSLSTAWDLSTASYDSVYLDPVSGIGNFYTVAFSTDGTKMFAGGTSLIVQYSLSTGFDLSTASYDNVSFNQTTQDLTLKSLVFNSDGTQFFMAGDQNDSIYQYSMTTAYDLSTASYDNISFSIASQESSITGLDFSNDGTKMYIIGFNTDAVYQYSTDVGSGSGGGSGIAWAGDRAVIVSGTGQYTSSVNFANEMEYYDITTLGNSADFGDLSVDRELRLSAAGSSTRGCIFGGAIYSTGNRSNIIDYVTIATTGNAQDFGDLTVARNNMASCSNGTRALTGGGFIGNGSYLNTIDYVTVATTGNAIDFGDLTGEGKLQPASAADSTRGIWAGSIGSNYSNTINYVTIATIGNAQDFGDLLESKYGITGVSDATYMLIAGGQALGGTVYEIERITIQTTGNATDFGDLTILKYYFAGTGNTTRATFSGGTESGVSQTTNDIQYVAIATPGNATDFGDCQSVRQNDATSGNAS